MSKICSWSGGFSSYETVQRWVNHFAPKVAADLRKRRPKPHATWHLDEVHLKINGRMVYLWRAVDAEGEVQDVLMQSRRNTLAALELMRKLFKRYGSVPNKLITDELRSYAANNRAENSHQPTGDGNVRYKDSRALRRRKGFSRRMQPSTTASVSSAISLQRGRTEPFVLRRWKRGALPSRLPESYKMEVGRVLFRQCDSAPLRHWSSFNVPGDGQAPFSRTSNRLVRACGDGRDGDSCLDRPRRGC
jgi:transposase-like protein